MTKIDPKQKVRTKTIDESNFGCLGKTPNGKRLADHYPWIYLFLTEMRPE